MASTVIFVHGSLSGPWTWQDVINELGGRGVDGVAVELPSHSLRDPAIDFRDDARCVRRVIDEVDGPVVLVGNSSGGLVITEAANGHQSVRRLVYLAALMFAAGQPLTDAIRGNSPEIGSAMRFRDDGLIEGDVDGLVKFGAQQASERAATLIRANAGGPMSFGTDPTATLTAATWETIPSTYIVCGEDLTISPAFQREMAVRAAEVVERPWDHWPQHSHHVELADLLEGLAREAG